MVLHRLPLTLLAIAATCALVAPTGATAKPKAKKAKACKVIKKTVKKSRTKKVTVRVRVCAAKANAKASTSHSPATTAAITQTAQSNGVQLSPAAPAGPIVQPATGGLRIGLASNFWGAGSPAFADLHTKAASTGVSWTREDLAWSKVEPQRGQFDWTLYDQLFESAAQRNLRILPVLDSTPAWAGANWNTVPADPADFANFTAKVVERYGPNGTFWATRPALAAFAATHFELWNEPYWAPTGGSDEYDPGRYARLVKAATLAGRAANPNAKFLLQAELANELQGSTWVNWIDALYAAEPNLNSYFDAIAVHPYGKDLTGLSGDGDSQFRRVEWMRDKFIAYGAADKPFWITELGWATCTGDSRCVTEAQQAANTTHTMAAIRAEYSGYVEAVFFYGYSDFGPEDQSNKENWFGLTRRDGSHKPAFDALLQATKS